MMLQTNIPDEQSLHIQLSQHTGQPEFRHFLSSCIKKWDEMQPEMDKIDCIMDSVCKTWGITRIQLITGRKYVEPRSFFFYVIHKKLDITYENIGQMFDRVKGNVHSGAKNIEFMLENRRRKDLVSAFSSVEQALELLKS